jgi:broad specificity phosphatase PhoE
MRNQVPMQSANALHVSQQHATLVFVRHAEAAEDDCQGHMRLCGWLDVPLTAQGQLEAERLRLVASELGPVDGLYTSSLRRAVETATPLAAALGLKPRARAALREISCGWLEGLPVREIQTCYPDVWEANLAQADESFGWPGGETYRAFRARVLHATRRVARAHMGRTLVIVTHAGVVTQILGALRGESAARWDKFRPGNASLTEIWWTGNSGVVVRFDDRHHLLALGPPERVSTPNDAQVLPHGDHGGAPLGRRATRSVQRDG